MKTLRVALYYIFYLKNCFCFNLLNFKTSFFIKQGNPCKARREKQNEVKNYFVSLKREVEVFFFSPSLTSQLYHNFHFVNTLIYYIPIILLYHVFGVLVNSLCATRNAFVCNGYFAIDNLE